VTAAPHTIDAIAWRSRPVSPTIAVELAVVVMLILALLGLGAMRAHAAVDGAARDAAVIQVRIVQPAIAAYGLDHSGYADMTKAALVREFGLAQGNLDSLLITGTSANGYCVQAHEGGWYVGQNGSSGEILVSHAPICK
jgi:hypothetical protein